MKTYRLRIAGNQSTINLINKPMVGSGNEYQFIDFSVDDERDIPVIDRIILEDEYHMFYIPVLDIHLRVKRDMNPELFDSYLATHDFTNDVASAVDYVLMYGNNDFLNNLHEEKSSKDNEYKTRLIYVTANSFPVFGFGASREESNIVFGNKQLHEYSNEEIICSIGYAYSNFDLLSKLECTLGMIGIEVSTNIRQTFDVIVRIESPSKDGGINDLWYARRHEYTDLQICILESFGFVESKEYNSSTNQTDTIYTLVL